MSYEIDYVLEAYLNAGEGASGVKWSQPYTDTLTKAAFREACDSPLGREARARLKDDFDEKVATEFAKRFANEPFYPSVPFRWRIEQILQDLLLEAPPAPVRPKGTNQYGVNLDFDSTPTKPVATKEQMAFALAFNKTMKEKGVQAVKPRGGVATLTMPNGSEYEYKAADANRLLNECIALGLIQ